MKQSATTPVLYRKKKKKVNEASNVENVNGKRKKSDAKAKISYRDSLDTITKARYVDKLKEIDGKDPYEMEKAEWSADMSEWPEPR